MRQSPGEKGIQTGLSRGGSQMGRAGVRVAHQSHLCLGTDYRTKEMIMEVVCPREIRPGAKQRSTLLNTEETNK